MRPAIGGRGRVEWSVGVEWGLPWAGVEGWSGVEVWSGRQVASGRGRRNFCKDSTNRVKYDEY